MKKIIVPTDFSYYSENALKTASVYAKFLNSEIIVVHMLELQKVNISKPYALKEEKNKMETAKNKLTIFLDKEYLKDVSVKFLVKSYSVFQELENLVRSENADLIIMGLHGKFSLKKVFAIGSNTEKVVRISSIPVLITQDYAVGKVFKNAVYPCSFSEEEITAYKKVKKHLKALGCNLKLLFINTPYTDFLSTKQQKQKFLNFIVKAGESEHILDKIEIISDFDIVKGILSYVDYNNPDVVVMTTHGRTGIEHFFNGSISEDTVELIDTPVITIKY